MTTRHLAIPAGIAAMLATMFTGCAATDAAADDRIPVANSDELPRHTYQIPGTAIELLEDDAQFAALAAQVRADLEADLAKYKIEDATTLKQYHGVLMTLDMLDGEYDSALEHVACLRELEDKEAARLMTGLQTEALIVARRMAGDDDAKFREIFAKKLLALLQPLPWEVVGDDLEGRKAGAEIRSRNLLMGSVQASLEPIIAKTEGEVSADIAQTLVGLRYSLETVLPLKAEMISVYSKIVAEHRVEKEDIWAARDAVLAPDAPLTPVVVAIWDSGVDTPIFKGQLWVNEKERADGVDNDGNGYVDDVHGIAYDLDANPVPELLHPIDDLNSDLRSVMNHMKGYLDLQSAIDSPEASAIKQMLGSIEPEEFQPFVEDFSLYGNYSHGTHVAGIAAAGNPFVRILAARLTFDYHMIPRCPTVEQAKKDVAAGRKVVDYFKEHGVRVVNMSWGESREMIESSLEANGAGENAEERAALAREIFQIQSDALYDAFKNAPDILFVTSAGNSDNDVEFSEMIPSGFDLPNLLVVGAVDQAGDPTDFTSFGGNVKVYANGFEVDSYVPGGERMPFSGTSMSSPNVVNLAAKLLACDPSLTPTQLIELIERGSDRVDGGQPMLLINPQKTLALLKK